MTELVNAITHMMVIEEFIMKRVTASATTATLNLRGTMFEVDTEHKREEFFYYSSIVKLWYFTKSKTPVQCI
jgi:hypothetical protein